MSIRLSSVFPRPSASDPDDVVWTLQTAAVQWQRGLRADAIVWVRKAADTATQLGRASRAEELRDQAARLAEFLWTDPEEPADDTLIDMPRRQLASRQSGDDDAEEIIEIEELEGYELEFSETDLPTPDDAVADIAAEDLTYFRDGEHASEPTHVLPDDLDLRSDSERTEASGSDHGAFVSVSPDSDDDTDYLSVSPEPDESADPPSNELGSMQPRSPSSERFADVAHVSDRPTRPLLSKPPTAARRRDDTALEAGRSPTLPSPSPGSPPRPRSAPGSSVSGMTIPRTAAPPTFTPPLNSSAGSRAAALSRAAEPVASAFSAAPAAYSYAIPSPVPPSSATFVAREPSPAESEAPMAESAEEQAPAIDGMPFESVEGLADLPEEAQSELAASGKLVKLTSGQHVVLQEGAAVITKGSAHVTLTFSDVSAARVRAGAVVAARGSIESGPLRLIADAPQTHIVTWTEAQLLSAMCDCPWVKDELRLLADRFQAHASAGLGPLGQRLDDALRAAVYERLEVRVLLPDECVAERGKPLKGLFVVAIGELNVASGAPLKSGQFLFPSCVISAEPAPSDVKAGPKGGLVLFATRPVAHELMMSVPPLLEILAS